MLNIGPGVLLPAFLALLVSSSALAAGVVGTGSVDSCTESALNAALAGGGTVTFNCGGQVTIPIGTTKVLTSDTTIDGGGKTTLSGGDKTRVLRIEGFGVDVTLENLAIVNGRAQGTESPDFLGGAIYNASAALTISNCRFTGNTADSTGGGAGGAIYNLFGTLDISGSTFSDNDATVFGGAIYTAGDVEIANSEFSGNFSETSGVLHVSNGTARVTGSSFTDNEASFFGGVAYNSGTLVVSGSTFSANRAGSSAGAIRNATIAIVTNSTFAGNSTEQPDGTYGGAIYNSATLTLTNATVVDGSASEGGNVYNEEGGSLTMTNTVVAGGSSGNCGGTIVDGGHNLDDGATCGFGAAGGSLSNTNPRLDPAGLKDNSGPTATIALCAAADEPDGCAGPSPAINTGDKVVCAGSTGTAPVDNVDQRGVTRLESDSDGCAIGAYEANVEIPELCGDGVRIGGEVCDDGDTEWSPGEACSADCAALACGDPNDSGSVTSADALFTLRVSVGIGACDLAVCDANGSGTVTTTDALRILRKAVGNDVEMDCP